jgi:hypothetical protein
MLGKSWAMPLARTSITDHQSLDLPLGGVEQGADELEGMLSTHR